MKASERREKGNPDEHLENRRRRRRVGPVRRFWAAVAVAAGLLSGWGSGEDSSRWDAFAGVRDEPTVLGLTVTRITSSGPDVPADAR